MLLDFEDNGIGYLNVNIMMSMTEIGFWVTSYIPLCSDPSKGFFCYAQGYSTHFFCVASFLWTTTIAFTLHRTVVRHKADVEDLEAMFHLYVWGTKLEFFFQFLMHFPRIRYSSLEFRAGLI